MSIVGNRLLWTAVAGLLAALGVVIGQIASGNMPTGEAIFAVITAIAAIFAALKGKRIETKLDKLNGNK